VAGPGAAGGGAEADAVGGPLPTGLPALLLRERGAAPFGSRYERDANVLCGRCDLFPVEHVPEAEHLIALLLQKDPNQR